MTDPTRHPSDDELQNWIDGELSAEDARRVAGHAAACDRCRAEAARIRDLLASLHELPRDVRAPEEILSGALHRLAGPRVVRLDPEGRGRRGARRAGLAAAAVALFLVGAIAGALLAPGGDRTASRADGPARSDPAVPAAGVELASVTAEYDAAVERLDGALRARRGELDPTTVRIVEENLRVIDRAIREASAALAADPANPVLRDLVVAGYEQKLDLLRRAVRPPETL